MSINYKTDKPTEDGWYLLEVDGELCVAEATLYSDGEVSWAQVGVDFDRWTYEYDSKYDIAVVCKLDLQAIADGAKRAE